MKGYKYVFACLRDLKLTESLVSSYLEVSQNLQKQMFFVKTIDVSL